MPDPLVTRAFVFGKLPSHGDFVSRGLSPDERDALDGWLARSLGDARASAGERFEQLYKAAPPWRFAWGEAAGWTAGAMAASVDAVGRRFPLLVGSRGLTAETVEGAADAAEGLLYDALAGGWDADRLHAAAGELRPVAGDPWSSGEGWWTLGGEGFDAAHLPGARPAGLMRQALTGRREVA